MQSNYAPSEEVWSESFKFFYLNHIVNKSLQCNRMNKAFAYIQNIKVIVLRLVTVRCSKFVCASKFCTESISFIIANFE